jgi:NAD(P)H-dependent FMN reductase
MKVAQVLQEQLTSLKVQSQIINLVDLHFPLYDSYKEEHDGIPKQTFEVIEIMKKSEAYIFISPEYNFSISPVLTNVIAWVSRVGDDFRELFSEKFIQLASFSGGDGTNNLNAMRTQFTKLGSIIMPRDILATHASPIREDSSLRILKQFIKFSKQED